jgi:hypothetical protein
MQLLVFALNCPPSVQPKQRPPQAWPYLLQDDHALLCAVVCMSATMLVLAILLMAVAHHG